MPRITQTALSAGELDPGLHAHADLAKYKTGLAHAENWFIRAQGGASTRQGTEFIAEEISYGTSSNVRYIEFEFSTDETYIIVLTHQRMSFMTNGGMILEAGKTITGATQANPCVVTTSAAHGFANDDQVFIESVAGMTEINGRFFQIDNVTATTFELVGIDSTAYTAYTSGGSVKRVYSIATPYNVLDLFDITHEQSADLMTLCHPTYAPRDLARISDTNWTLTTTTFGSAASAPSAGLAVAQVGTASGANNKTYRYRVTSVDTDGFESTASSIVSSGSINALSSTYGNQISWTAVGGVDYYVVYKELSLNSGIFGFIGEADNAQFTDFNLGPDMSITPPLGQTPFNSANNYPACSAYHQERRVYAGSNNAPQEVKTSKTGLYVDFNYSRPTRADDSITKTLNAQRLNRIRHMISLNELLLFTSGGEWAVEASDGTLTPTDFDFARQGNRGVSTVEPQVVGDTVLYVQARGTRVRDLNYEWENSKYKGDDLTVLSRFLFEGYTIVDTAYQQEPYSILWVVRSDGQLLSLTYLREHQIYAWTHHVLGGAESKVKTIAVVPEGTEDAVYMAVERTINGETKVYNERLSSRVVEEDTIENYVGSDSALTYSGAAVDTITGLWHLEGEEVVILADGNVIEGVTITNGEAAMPAGTNATKAVIGLQYNCDLETLELGIDGRTVQGRRKQVAKVTLRVKHSRGLSWGQRDGAIYEFPERTPEMGYGRVPLQTGTQAMELEPGWTDTGQVFIRQAQPLPSTILSITPELEISG